MVLVALAYLAGLVVGRHLMISGGYLLAPALAIALWHARGLYRFRRLPGHTSQSGWLLLAAIALPGWAASNHAIRVDRRADAIAQSIEAAPLIVAEGTIAELPRVDADGQRLVLDDVNLWPRLGTDSPIQFPLKLYVMTRSDMRAGGTDSPNSETIEEAHSDDPAFVQGMRVRAWGRLRLAPGRTTPGQFDYSNYLRGRGVGAMLLAGRPADIEVVAPGSRWATAIFGHVQRTRDAMLENLKQNLSADRFGIASAVLLGERDALDDDQLERIRRVGAGHVISVSGLHTGLVFLLMLTVARLMGLSPRAVALVGLCSVWSYALLTGMRPPVVRAAVMATFLLGGWATGRSAALISALAVSALATLLFDPRNLIRTDWQLSYVCVTAIAFLAAPIYQLLGARNDENDDDEKLRDLQGRWRGFFRRWILIPLVIVIAVQLGLMPLQAELFGRFSPLGIFAQPIVIPMVFAILSLGLIVAIGGGIAPVGAVAGWALGFFVDIFEVFTTWLSSLPWATVELPPMAPWLIAVYFGVLLIGPHVSKPEGQLGDFSPPQLKHMAYRMLIVLIGLIGLAWSPIRGPATPPGELTMYALDVGQGDGIVLVFPCGEVAVVDAGRGSYGDQGRRTVAPLLRSLGVRRIDLVVATHSDSDHVGGLRYLVENFEVGIFAHGSDDSGDEEYQALLEALERRHVQIEQVRAGDELKGFGAAQIDVLHPPAMSGGVDGLGGLEGNDASVVLLVDLRDVEILLTGDIEDAAERAIVESGLARDIDILKVAHHGSKTSSGADFLESFDPEFALISAGRNNTYGHPAREILDRFAARDTIVIRTDQQGSIRLRTDGEQIRIDHFSR